MIGIGSAFHQILNPIAPAYDGLADMAQAAPFIVYQRIGGDGFDTFKGPARLKRSRVQVDGYSQTVKGRNSLRRSILSVLEGYKGVINVDSESIRIASCVLEAEQELIEDELDNRLFRVSIDFSVLYEE